MSLLNFVTTDHKVSNSCTGNELYKDLRKWVSPPDPSVNFNTASDAHHEGTSAWCRKRDTALTWKVSGSLLWIHGKRIYPISTARAWLFTDDIFFNSRLREEYSQVRCSLSSCVPVELKRSYRQAPLSLKTSNLCPMPAPLSWPIFTSVSGIRRSKTPALSYRLSLSNSRINPISSVTFCKGCTRRIKMGRNNRTPPRSFDVSRICSRSRNHNLFIS